MGLDSARLGWENPLPGEDRALSPMTGLTRQHWAGVADNLLLAVRAYRSPSGAHIDLPGYPARAGTRSDGLEGFARTFLLAAIRMAGENGADAHGLFADYVAGLVAGTQRARATTLKDERWQAIGDTGPGGQPMVESASIALGLQLTRRWSWDVLSAEQRDDVEAWLRGALRREPAPNNWYLFPMTVAGFLDSVGRGDDETRSGIERALFLLEGWYRGEGWYSDGDGRAFDHYVGWALHFYPVLYAMLRAREEPSNHVSRDLELFERLRDRLRTFLATFALTFDRNGSPIYLGRSLTYRIAAVASLGLGEVASCSPLRPGQSRRVMSATLKYFLDRGAVVDGLLSSGWHGTHAASVQPYSGPASPYWASKGFIGLLLPAEHRLWASPEEDLEDETHDQLRGLRSVGWLIQRTGSDGIARVHNHGSDHVVHGAADGGQPDPLYARLAYSTRTGNTALRNPSDNDVQVTFRGVPSVRRRIHPLGVGTDWAASFHVPRFPLPIALSGGGAESAGPVLPSCRIESLVIARGAWEVRVHRFIGIPNGASARLSGWALAADTPRNFVMTGFGGSSADSNADGASTAISLAAAGLHSDLVALLGWSDVSHSVAPQGTAFGRFAIVPEATALVVSGFFAAALRLTEGDRSMPPDVTETGEILIVRWGDGSHRVNWTAKEPDVVWNGRREDRQ
ncbi:MAG TPA: DUF2264 domain-containing protein [Microbacteriaceae bacterium]